MENNDCRLESNVGGQGKMQWIVRLMLQYERREGAGHEASKGSN